MSKPFKKLKDKMSPESQARTHMAFLEERVEMLEAENERLRIFILSNHCDHGVDSAGEYCKYGEFTRCFDDEGYPEIYGCTCGLNELRKCILGDKQP